jgi:hypothetical protein
VLTLFNHLDTTLTLAAIEMSLAIRRIYHKVDWSTKELPLKETGVPYYVSVAGVLLADEVVILEKEGQPVAALVPITEYAAFQSWRETVALRSEK